MNILIPKYLTFGADIKNIQFTDSKVTKIFKNNNSYQKTILFYSKFCYNTNLFPQLFFKDDNLLLIETENCGDLVNLYNIPYNWKQQINNFRSFFIEKNVLILDIRFMPHTPYVLNNLCLKNNTIYLVDLALYDFKSTHEINTYFDNLIYNIECRLKYKNNIIPLFLIHIYLEFNRYINDFLENIMMIYNNVTSR